MPENEKYNFSHEFIEFIIKSSSGFFPPSQFELLIESFEEYASLHHFTRSSESNLIRIISALFDKISFFLDCLKYPHYPEFITTIAANSNYLTDIIVQSPEYLYQVFNPQYLEERVDEKTVRAELLNLDKYKTLAAKLNILRLIKRKLILKIGLRDLLGEDEVKSTTAQLAALAKVINAELFALCHYEILQKYGFKSTSRKYCIISLGKLGGNELNYSSDADLILFFDKDSKLGRNKAKEYHDLLIEAAFLFIKSSTDITEKGYIYRVDFRLRPDGRNSPICRTIGDYIRYYETRSEDWERQMLIKMDFVGGDKNLYETFRDYIEHYIYPLSFDSSPLLQIKKMKQNIERLKDIEDNIKLLPGGIRDIEFSVQALQLLNGGRHPELRTGNSLEAISQLVKLKLLSNDEEEIFSQAYILYRRIEHYLQLMNDIQTHNVPTEGETAEKLAIFLGYKNFKSFSQSLANYRMKVREIYNSILQVDEVEKPRSIDELSKINFIDKPKAFNNFKYLQSGMGVLGIKEFDQKTTAQFQNIEEAIIDCVGKSIIPDMVLDNATRFIKLSGFPSVWYSLFNDGNHLSGFLKMCEYSSRAIEMCATDKTLFELFLSGRVFYKNLAELTDVLSIKQMLFILAVKHALNFIDHSELAPVLCGTVASKLTTLANESKFSRNYFIATLGSFGSDEMTFSSDIDLIFVSEGIDDSSSIQTEFQKYFNDARQILKPFEVDCRLRPEGKNSPLVWDVETYQTYLHSRARIWEFQALSKLRFIAGDNSLFQKFESVVFDNITRFSRDEIFNETRDMFQKIQRQNVSMFPKSVNLKKTRGGLTTIEFIVQANLLANPQYFKENAGKSTLNRLQYLSTFTTAIEEFKILSENYRFLKNAECSLQNIFNSNNSLLPVDENKRKLIAQKLGFENLTAFEKKMNEVIKLNSFIFDNTFAIKR
ncbi:MAG: hypothetical protein V1720_13850 [bacterium]